jgi:hypothetical protein
MVQHLGTAPKTPHPRSGCLRLLPVEPRSRTEDTSSSAGEVGGDEGELCPIVRAGWAHALRRGQLEPSLRYHPDEVCHGRWSWVTMALADRPAATEMLP